MLIRLLDDATGFQILFYRSISLTLIVLVVICIRRKTNPLTFFKSIDKHDLLMGGWLAAVIAWKWIGEIPRLVTWPTMTVASFGVGLMVYDGANLGYSPGNICAFISAFCFAVMLVVARRSPKIDVLGGTFMAGVFR